MQMKTEVSLELAKAGVSSAIDVEHTEIEVVEAESPLATLVKQTLDSVLCRHSEDLTHSSSSHSPLKSSTSLLTSKPLLDTMLEQPVSSDKSDLQTLPLLTVSQHETVMTESELPTDTLLPSTAVSLPEQRPHHEISLNDKSLESVNQKSMSDSTLSPVTHSSSTRRSKSPHKDVGVDSPGKKELVPVIEPLTVDVIDSFTGSSPSKKSPLRSSLSPAKSRDHSEVSKKGYSSEESPVVSANQPRYSLRKSLSPKIPSSPSPRSSKHTSSTHSLGEETESKTSPLVVTESVQCIEDSSEKLLGSQGSPIICGDEIVPPTNDDDDKVHDTGTKDSQKHSDPSLVIGEEITQNIKQYYLRCHDDRQNQSKRPSISPRSKSSRSTPSPIKSSPGKNSGSASSTPKSSNAADRDRPKVTSESPILRRKNAEGATKSASPKASPAKSPKGRSHKEASLIKTLSEDDLPSDVVR